MAILSTVVILTYLSALRLTAVADVMIIQATLPFVVAGLAWLAMRERASRATLVASVLATAGVMITLAGAPLAGNSWGDALAFVTTVVYVPPRDATQEEVVRFYLSRLQSWESRTRTAPALEGAGEIVYRVDFTRGDECVALMTYGMAPSQDPADRSFGLAASTEQGGCGAR